MDLPNFPTQSDNAFGLGSGWKEEGVSLWTYCRSLCSALAPMSKASGNVESDFSSFPSDVFMERKSESVCHSVMSDSFVTPCTVAHQAPLSMGFSRQECWSGLPFPSPGDLPDPGIKSGSPALQAVFFFYHLSHQGSP